ncbi:type III pantothenate kinase [Spirosoma endophyticum]|uniref:Type III pantothenate kinase n=1 Tax=Spirosoma endophyticum TaxID=662367 RepID=A0A1I2FI04_9BACT|nr:type III pantothenate kinase [Spirosoma endophyticum]SFF04519.1 type III pantothenate kinase [Spirosoma endophyticum]
MGINRSPTQLPTTLNLVVDWGNSSLKTGWFDGPMLIETGRYGSPDELAGDLESRSVGHMLVSSTSRPADEIRTQLLGLKTNFWLLDSQTAVPIRKAYDTPTTLGTDRIAAATGAVSLFPGQDCLVLDLGTCLTADFVDQDAVFQGGLISPGLRMRFRAMHEQTARLPLVDMASEWPGLTARNTKQAMQSGAMNGLLFEIHGIIAMYRQQRPGIVVLVCGGDAASFESRLKQPIFAVPELVLIGLNRILRYNVENIQANTPDVNA